MPSASSEALPSSVTRLPAGTRWSGPATATGAVFVVEMVAVSGALSLLITAGLFLALPVAAVWALGLLIGVDLIFLGVSQIAIAMALSSDRGGA